MLGETEFLVREKSTVSGPSQAVSKIEVADYTQLMAAELKSMAERAGLSMLAYLLSMVVLCASELAAKSDAMGSNQPRRHD